MSELKTCQIGDVAEIIGGGTPSTKNEENFGGDIAWITPKDLSDHDAMYISKGERSITSIGLKNSSAKLLPANSILFTSRAPIGYVALAKNEITTNQGFKSLVLKDDNDPKFFYYLLKNITPQIKSYASGSTFQEISGKVLSTITIKIPNANIQKRIGEFIEKFDKKIELNKKTNETLECIAKAVFKSWFVDFDPVRAKAEGLSLGLADEISNLFPDSLEDSELGEIPKDWEIHKLRNFIDVKGGLSYKSQFIGSGKNLITMGCISPHKKFNFPGLKKYSGDFKESNLLRHKDIVISTRDVTQDRITLGAPAMVPNVLDGSILATNLYKVIFVNKTLSCYFLFESIKSKRYRENIIASAKGSTVLMLTRDSVLDYKIVVPKDDLMNRFHNLCEIIQRRYELIENETKTLVDLRDKLLPKLITGELRIPDAKKMIDEVGI